MGSAGRTNPQRMSVPTPSDEGHAKESRYRPKSRSSLLNAITRAGVTIPPPFSDCDGELCITLTDWELWLQDNPNSWTALKERPSIAWAVTCYPPGSTSEGYWKLSAVQRGHPLRLAVIGRWTSKTRDNAKVARDKKQVPNIADV